MAIHILGNGPSLNIFNRNDWYNSDVFVGCNFSDPSFYVDYTSLIDVAAIKHLLKGHDPGGPLLLSTRAARYADSKDPNWRDKTPKIEAIVDLPRDRTISRNLSMNSAQHAAAYTLRNYPDHSEVHLWGIDSFWSTNLESKTDEVVRPNQRTPRIKPKVTQQWNKYWHNIFLNNLNRTFIIHVPHQGVELVSGLSDTLNVRIEIKTL